MRCGVGGGGNPKNCFTCWKERILPSPSLMCTVCMPRIREPELEEFVGQGKWQEVERA